MIGDVLPKSQEAKRLDAKEGSETAWRVIGTANSCVEAGSDNTLSGTSYRVLIFGEHNDVIYAWNTAVIGSYNVVGQLASQIADAFICGNHNTALGGSNGLFMSGRHNKAYASASQSFLGGQYNESKSRDNLTIGMHNVNNAEECIMCGEYGESSGGFDRIVVGNGTSNSRSNCFRVNKLGKVFASEYNTSGADYAEYFEWAGGNPDGEDRRGMLVQLIGDKIAPAHGDDILGAVSCRASVIGNAYEEHWHGKYKTDVFGAYIPDKDGNPQLSDDYDKEREYIPRSQRQEWAAIGLVGRLIIRDNGKCEPGGYVTARQGVGAPTFKETRARCIRRLDGSHIEIIVR